MTRSAGFISRKRLPHVIIAVAVIERLRTRESIPATIHATIREKLAQDSRFFENRLREAETTRAWRSRIGSDLSESPLSTPRSKGKVRFESVGHQLARCGQRPDPLEGAREVRFQPT